MRKKSLRSRLNAESDKAVAVVRGVVGPIRWAAARVLAAYKGEPIEIGEFPEMNERCVRIVLLLAEEGKLSIAWVKALYLSGCMKRSTILALARYADSVNLEGLPDLTAIEANAFADFKGCQILLYLKKLDKRIAVNLAKASPEILYVNARNATVAGLIALSESNAGELQICLESGSLSVRAAAALARFRGHTLWFVLQKSPTVSVMREIAQFDGYLSIYIPVITPDIAKVLADSYGTLELDYDKSTDPVVGSILSKSNREITNLDNLIKCGWVSSGIT